MKLKEILHNPHLVAAAWTVFNFNEMELLTGLCYWVMVNPKKFQCDTNTAMLSMSLFETQTQVNFLPRKKKKNK